MKLAALLAGTALALVPTGTAFAGDTGQGLARGNCGNSSKGGVHKPLLPEVGHGKGNGGLVRVTSCLPSDPPADQPADPPAHAPADPPAGPPAPPDDVIFV